MKNHEKEIKQLLSDDMLAPRESFKRNLRTKVIKQSHPTQGLKRRYMVPAIATSFAAIAVVAGILTFDQQDLSRNPLQPQSVSAKELIRKIVNQPRTLGQSGSSFVTYAMTTQQGPDFNWCSREGLGDKGGEIRAYVFNAKDSGHEALYITLVGDDGAIHKTQYYSPNAESLIDWSAGFDGGIGIMRDQEYLVNGLPYYLIVDAQGNQLKDDTLTPKTVNGRQVYEFYIKENIEATMGDYAPEPRDDGSVWCDPRLIVSKVVVDVKTDRTTQVIRYHGTAKEANREITYNYNLNTSDASEDEALRIMTAAGFNKREASTVNPQ
jgi:hypothetical protein